MSTGTFGHDTFGYQGRLILARFGGVNGRSLRLLSVAALIVLALHMTRNRGGA